MTLRLVSLPDSGMLATVKDHARVDTDADDALIAHDIEAAVEQVERAARVGFSGGTWEWTADSFPSGNICIGFGPITSITAFGYLDEEGTEQTLDAAEYTFNAASLDGLIYPVDAWPATAEHPKAVTVRFVAGDGVIPAPIHRAIRLMVAEGYDDREKGGELTGPAQRLVGMYRRPWF